MFSFTVISKVIMSKVPILSVVSIVIISKFIISIVVVFHTEIYYEGPNMMVMFCESLHLLESRKLKRSG
jgi:cation transport ATPase